MTLIKQEKLVFILVILYIQEYLCFYRIVYRYPSGNRKHTALGEINNDSISGGIIKQSVPSPTSQQVNFLDS